MITNLISVSSTILKRDVHYTLFIPVTGKPLSEYHLLILNDGQDAAGLRIEETLDELVTTGQIKPVMIAAVVAGDRMQEYGIAGKPDFKKRGSRALLYTQAILDEIIPSIEDELDIEDFRSISVAGCSMGGLSAFDMAWNYPEVFSVVGAFSGSFWWRSRDLGKNYNDATDRIMHQEVKNGRAYHPAQRFWFEAGTEDERADRNKNGIIDAIDDTLDLISELEAKGYQRGSEIAYEEIEGGKHNIPTWANAMPKFLTWAFG